MGKKKKRLKMTQMFATPDRWLPADNTRACTFADRTKVNNKKAARGRTYRADDCD